MGVYGCIWSNDGRPLLAVLENPLCHRKRARVRGVARSQTHRRCESILKKLKILFGFSSIPRSLSSVKRSLRSYYYNIDL